MTSRRRRSSGPRRTSHLPPVFTNGDLPPLEADDESFDLIYGASVFTHPAESWSRWLLELHRLLRPGGLMVLTFLGEDMAEACKVDWDEERIGMLHFQIGNPWSNGGPIVMHSEWWIRTHWGRAFEIVELRPRVGEPYYGGHGSVLLHKDERSRLTLDARARRTGRAARGREPPVQRRAAEAPRSSTGVIRQG